ncbi:MAG: SIS domain-containing protein [Gammaproteobacteria bacterium]|nr:SIS domain-containing protein [Gammaproteobacteria bacterium]
MQQHIKNALGEARAALDALLNNEGTLSAISRAATLLIDTIDADGRMFSCGNGGSMCDAMHFAEEITGRFRKDRRAFAATAISDPGHLSCVGNDYGYDEVFARYMQAHGRKGDCLVAISTSGSSKNILRAAEVCRSQGISVIALTGKPGSTLEQLADVCICTPGGQFADRVQELHIKVLHILIELIERKFCPENY